MLDLLKLITYNKTTAQVVVVLFNFKIDGGIYNDKI